MNPNPTLEAFFDMTDQAKEILNCIQCGTCSGSCPFADQMDHAPRAIFALIRDNDMEVVLASNTMWFCSSCYQCMDRCPQEIPVTDIMYTLKQMAVSRNTAPTGVKMPDLYDAFARNLTRFGRVSDPLVMARYGMKHPLDAIKNLPLALRMMVRKRLELKPQATQNRHAIRRLLEQHDTKEAGS